MRVPAIWSGIQKLRETTSGHERRIDGCKTPPGARIHESEKPSDAGHRHKRKRC